MTRDDALRGEHRRGPELDLEPRRILAEIAVVEPDDFGLGPSPRPAKSLASALARSATSPASGP